MTQRPKQVAARIERAALSQDDSEAPSPERLQRALVLVAYLATTRDARIAQLLDRLEAELARAMTAETPLDRARRILEAYTIEGGRNAIAASTSTFCSSVGPRP